MARWPQWGFEIAQSRLILRTSQASGWHTLRNVDGVRLWDHSEAQTTAPPSLVVCSGLAISAVALLLSIKVVSPAATSGLLPRWDLAAHLLNGWTTYDHVVNGRLVRFLWDIWTQGYWPPGQSLFQVPFYAAAGGSILGGLLSSTAAFGLTAAASVVLLGHIAGHRAWLSAALTVALISTSPFFLAYATVAMSEMVGALVQVIVLVCYARHERTRDADAMRWLAISLSLLFFTKYNYFILLAVPLACHAFLAHAAGTPARARLRAVRRAVTAWGATAPGLATVAYLFIVVAILSVGGFSASAGDHRIAFRTVGYSLHPLLYGWLAYAWNTHRQGRWDLRRLAATDPRLPPFILWFVVPATVWLASPLPNHIKDLVYLVVNVPMGPESAQLGLTAYLNAIRTDYFAHPVVFVAALGAFLNAAVRYRSQPPLIRLLIAIAALQFAMVAAHQTRDARFLLLAMPPFWIVGAHEIGTWLGRQQPSLATTAAVVTLCASVAGAHVVISAPPFRRLAVEHYVRSTALDDTLSAIRDMVPREGDVALIGRRDNVSPSLMKWQLGPPSGLRQFPQEITRETDLPRLDSAAMVVLIEPSEVSTIHATERVMAHVDAGTLVPTRTFPVADIGVSIRVFLRARD